MRNIEKIIQPGHLHWVGDAFRMLNVTPMIVPMERMNPFIGIEYAPKYYFAASNTPRGAGSHPHRGFETVSIMYKGSVAHGDSAGGGGVIEEGETQWMTAGSGVLHKEYLEENFNAKGGDMQMVQLWVNLPAKDKMAAPNYQAVTKNNLKTVALDDNGSVLEIVSGTYNGATGTATTFSPVNVFNLKLKKGGKARFDFAADFNTGMLVTEGKIKINDAETVDTDLFALFKNENGSITVEAVEDASVLVLSGQDLKEPIAAHGPFVMNTREQIVAAFQDYNLGKFGYLED